MGDGTGGFQREKTTGEWIRDHLDRSGPSYVKEMHQGFTMWCEERGYSGPTYASFRRTVWLLKELGLVEVAHTEPSGPTSFADRHYYRLAAGVDHQAAGWRDPVKVRYGRD